jgi:hypothetical protein
LSNTNLSRNIEQADVEIAKLDRDCVNNINERDDQLVRGDIVMIKTNSNVPRQTTL